MYRSPSTHETSTASALSEERDYDDEIHMMSQKFRTATTIEPAMSASSANSSDDENRRCLAIRNLPEINLPEKIVLVVDTVTEQGCTAFKLGTGTSFTPLSMTKRALETFACIKTTIQREHSFALMSLDSRGAQWLCDFTSNVKTLSNHLDNLIEDVVEKEPKICQLGCIFEKIVTKVQLPKQQAPTFTVRVILIYSRSNSIPKFSHMGRKHLENLTENPYFFLDALFVHEPPNDDNTCNDVYAELTALDTTGFSYIFEVGRDAAKLHNNMAKLLAHPLQRPPQKDAFYDIRNLREVHTNV